jgi:hypothetical protein
MVKATRRKASQPAVWAGVQPKKSQALPAPYEENRSSLERYVESPKAKYRPLLEGIKR